MGKHAAKVLGDLKSAIELVKHVFENPAESTASLKKFELDVYRLIQDAESSIREYSPIKHPNSIFDPGNPKIVGRFASLALVSQDRHSLKNIGKFYGSGIYALYYNGSFKAYKPISKTETPIYVGLAAPERGDATTVREQGPKLSGRLTKHMQNISKANSTLKIEDFEYRYLVVQSGWQSAAEAYLIDLFKPIWNNETKLVYGFGKHGDSAATRGNTKSPWDSFHPGRDWAAPSKELESVIEKTSQRLFQHFEQTKVYKNVEEVLAGFIGELNQNAKE